MCAPLCILVLFGNASMCSEMTKSFEYFNTLKLHFTLSCILQIKMLNLTQFSMSSMLTPIPLPPKTQEYNHRMQKRVKVAKVLWLITYWELEEKEGLLINLSFHAPYYTIVNWIESVHMQNYFHPHSLENTKFLFSTISVACVVHLTMNILSN